MKINFTPFVLLSLVLTMVACGPAKDRVRFEGKLENIDHAEFYVYSEDGAFEGMDTIRMEGGKFTYERKLTEPVLLTLLYPNFTQTYVVAEPGKTVKMRGDASRIGEAEITGTEPNNELTEFRLDNQNGPAGNQRLAAAQFIRTHAQSLAAVAVYRMYFARPHTDVKTSLQLLNVLKKAQPKSRAVRYLDDFYRPMFVNGVGSKLPAFSAETLDGRKVSSDDYKGKHLVIACLGSWHNESAEFVRQLRTKMKSAGKNWECLVVSMDLDREVLRNRLRRDSLSYPIVCDRLAFESPLVQRLGLRYVPSLMIVSPEGIIVQRDVQKVEDAKIK